MRLAVLIILICILLPVKFYPWGVCLGPSSELSWTEDDWTRDAMYVWNNRFEDFKKRIWGTHDVVRIPKGALFVESCDSDEHNIIYLYKEKLSFPSEKIYTLGYYQPHHYWWDFMNFHANIVMDSNTKWNRAYFMNVMIHELGHALGIPHIQTDIMQSHGFGCKNYKTTSICALQDYDFDKFLQPYKPPSLARQRKYEENMIIMLREATVREMNCLQGVPRGCIPR